jgi:hypothetical protein
MEQSGSNPAAALWLKQLRREELHGHRWIEVNKRFHDITRAVRPFLLAHYPDEKEREAAFDGITIALLLLARAQDIQRLNSTLFESTSPPTEESTGNESPLGRT